MRRVTDPARRERERLLTLERRETARAEARAVADGVAESVALSRARGAAFEAPKGKGPRDAPYRRQSGLDWLARKGRISEAQKAAGLAYGACLRRARTSQAIPSSWEVKPGMGDLAGPALEEVLAHAEGTVQATARLAKLRARLSHHAEMIAACDLVCGDEMTPREAAGGEREGVRMESVLRVALDLLAG